MIPAVGMDDAHDTVDCDKEKLNTWRDISEVGDGLLHYLHLHCIGILIELKPVVGTLINNTNDKNIRDKNKHVGKGFSPTQIHR